MSDIKVEGGKTKILDSTWKNDQIVIIVILAILRFKIQKQTKSLSVNILAYLMDSIRKNNIHTKSAVLLSTPWHFDDQLRKRILMANELKLITVLDRNSRIRLNLTESGIELIDEIIKQGLMKGLLERVRAYCGMVNMREFKKQHLSW